MVTFWKTLLRWTIPAAGLCAACWLLIRTVSVRSWGTLLALAAGYAILYMILLWLIGLRKEEKAWVRSSVGRMRSFLRHRT